MFFWIDIVGPISALVALLFTIYLLLKPSTTVSTMQISVARLVRAGADIAAERGR
jgi:hypothetical protein